MENPKQIPYQLEQLFRLKPEVVESPAALSKIPISSSSDQLVAIPANRPAGITQELSSKEPGFWIKNRWYIIGGGFVLVAGIACFIYQRNHKKKETGQRK